MPIQLAHSLAKRLTTVRKDGTLGYLRPDGKTQVTIEYEGNRPVRVHTVVVSTQHAEDVSVDQIAASASISASECLRCFHDMIGTTPNQYLRDRRAQRAAELLCGTGLSVTEIAGQCGFQDGSYFARSFRQVYGCGPTEYRRKARRAGAV